MIKNPPEVKETWAQSLGREDPLEEEMVTHSSILACRILWTENPAGYSPWGHKESDTTEWLTFTWVTSAFTNLKMQYPQNCLELACSLEVHNMETKD